MRPLLFVNWASVAARFTAVMWALALVLACVVLAQLEHPTTDGRHATRSAPHRLVSTR